MFINLFKNTVGELLKRKAYSLSVIMTLALALGALFSVSTLVYLIFAKPLPYPQYDRLYSVTLDIFDKDKKSMGTAFNYPTLDYIYKEQTSFEKLAMVAYGFDIVTSLTNQPQKNVTAVTPDWFTMLGANFIIGRGFTDSEDLRENNPVVVISYETWQRDFNGTENILSETLRLGQSNYKIIGVLQSDFAEPQLRSIGRNTDIWLPWDYNSYTFAEKIWGRFYNDLKLVGLVKQGISERQLEQQLNISVPEQWQSNVMDTPYLLGWSVNVNATELQETLSGSKKQQLILLFLGVVSLLVIACSNIVNLFLSRTSEQLRSLSIRAALGAKKNDLRKLLWVEIVTLLSISALIGLLIAHVTFGVLKDHLSSMFPRLLELEFGFITLAIALVSVITLSLVFSYICSGRVNYRSLVMHLQSSGKGNGIQISKKVRDGFTVSQAYIVLLILIVNFSLLSDALKKINVDLGYDIENVYDLRLSHLDFSGTSSKERQVTLDEIADVIRSADGVTAVSQSSSIIQGSNRRMVKLPSEKDLRSVRASVADEHYFELLNQSLLIGENFTKADIQDGNKTMLVNEAFASLISEDKNVVGVGIDINGDNNIYTIKGVYRNAREPLQLRAEPRIYLPRDEGIAALLVKFNGNAFTREKVAQLIKSLNSQYVVFSYEGLDKLYSDRLLSSKVTLVTTLSLSFICLSLAVIGLYGVSSYNNSTRRLEIGIRMAIGAKANDIAKLVIKDNVKPTLLGVFLSLSTLALVLTTGAYSVELNNDSITALIFISSILLVVISVCLSSYLPLRSYIYGKVINNLRD